MVRSDIGWIIPCVLIAFYQINYTWKKLPFDDPKYREIADNYSYRQKLGYSLLKYFLYVLFFLELSCEILPISNSLMIILILRFVGYTLIFFGFLLSSLALKNLGANWSGMINYRIKKGQCLVIRGVYKYIRHPIYLAVILEIAGYQLVVHSWLIVILTIAAVVIFLYHIQKEDNLLENKFGNKFIKYKNSTGLFFPKKRNFND